MVTKTKNLKNPRDRETDLMPVYARNAMELPVPKFELADQSACHSNSHLPFHTSWQLV